MASKRKPPPKRKPAARKKSTTAKRPTTASTRATAGRAPARKSPARKRTVRKSWARRWGRRLAVVAIVGMLFFMLLVAAMYALAKIPDPNDIARAQSVTVLDVEGRTVGRISSEADRVSIPLEEMPKHLRNAVIATEDRRFYRHKGVSLISIGRAAVRNAMGRSVVQGGSTITQQYVKNAFVGNERTMIRKVREAIIALKLERKRSKDEILELYLNTIYFGRGAYGVEAASQTYFGKAAKALTLPESALLGGIIQQPQDYDPAKDEDAARGRRGAVLRFMVRDGYITQRQADEANDAKISARKRVTGGRAPHFLDEVRRVLEDEIGPRRLYAGGMTVRSTLNLKMQQAAEDAVAEVYDRKSDPEAALVAIAPKDGSVRAMVGSRDYARRQLNIAARARRQPGSTFKPAVLAAAIEDGISIRKTYPAPGTIELETDSGPWKVSNYDLQGRGRLDLSDATERSVNTVYAQLIMDVGPGQVTRTAHRLGISSKLSAVPSLALGTSEVSPLELTSMYATFAARGVHHEPIFVEEVKDREGKVLFTAERTNDQALARNDADTVNKVLQGVIEEGTGRTADIGRPAAGKTGTTENFRDAWFAGYTPDLATVVWNGYPGGNKKLRDVRGIDVVGSSFPAQMWRLFMAEALKDVPPSKFAEPKIRGDEDAEGSKSPAPSPTRSSTTLPTVEPSEEPSVPTKTLTPKPSPSRSKSKEPSPSPSPTASG